MGNCFRRLRDGDDSDLDTYYPQSSYGGHEGGGYPPRPGLTTITYVGFTAFVRDLADFQATNEVPRALSRYVFASKATQRLWFLRLLNAWRRANPAPTSEETVAVLLIQTLQDCSDIQGLLRFYHLPWPTVPVAKPVLVPATQPVPVAKPVLVPTTQPVLLPAGKLVPARKPVPAGKPVPADKPAPGKPKAQALAGKQKREHAAHAPASKRKKKPAAHATASKPDRKKPKASGARLVTPKGAEGIEYEFHTLPVNWEKDEGDGDGLTVFVNVLKDAREARLVPKEVQDAVLLRHTAQAQNNYKMADALQKKIKAAKYKVFDGTNDGACYLARKYKIRLRGVDAPEIDQLYGEEARDLLRGLVKDQQLLIRVYGTDKYEREVADIYCNDIFIQEVLLKSGSVWHYKFFDTRKTFAEWHRAAKEACIGLWADPNPEAPWDFRKREKKEGSFRIRGA